MHLRIASFNIHACIGSDGRFDPARTASVIREIDADVLALQEVEHHLLDNEDLLDYLARTTGYQAVAGPTLMRETRHYGNALLTRLPVITSQSRDISVASHSSEEKIAEFRHLIINDPNNYIAQPTLKLSVSPTSCGDKIAPRHVDLRPFILSGRSHYVTPGGLTRVALVEGSLVVNSSQGGGSKDTWIVDEALLGGHS